MNRELVYNEIANIVEPGSRVLDLGCGDGSLLKMLMDRKDIYGLGIDFSTEQVLSCIKRGVSVIQEDIDEGLGKYKDESYDYVILSETLQTVKRPDFVISQIVRIGKKAIVAFPNFANWKLRTKFFITGRMPKSDAFPYEWYNTPNIHLLTIKDFKVFCKQSDIKILKETFIVGDKIRNKYMFGNDNFFAEEAIFTIKKGWL